jgi:hypothetical protein
MRTKAAKTRLLDGIVSCHPFERKYLIKLLTGKRAYLPHRGRSPSYRESARRLAATLWRSAGMPCAEYLKPMLPKLADDAAALGAAIDPVDREQVLRMSASTIGRSVRGLRKGPARRRNKRSGTWKLRASIPAMPGSELPEHVPGACQVDSVALCGGDMSGSFFPVATLTDAATQWFECAPSWNHGAEATTGAMQAIHARLPFTVLHLHPDNGSEFINHLFIRRMTGLIPAVQWSRSRPYRKNDNCRIEQKNGSIIRDYFGDIRFDDPAQQDGLARVCRDIALYSNLFRPCKKLVSKRRKDVKGVKYATRYDAPRTPLERMGDHLPSEALSRLHALREQTNSIVLLRSIQSQLRKLVRDMRSGGGLGGIPPPPPPEPAQANAPRPVSSLLTAASRYYTPLRCPSLLT